MDASTLFTDLTKAGITLRIEGERLVATPGHRLTESHRNLIREHKPALLALVWQAPEVSAPALEVSPLAPEVSAPQLTAEDLEGITEAVEERAGILAFDAGLPRPEAERQAASAMRVFQAQIAMPGADPRRLVLLAPGCDLEEARQTLNWRFGPERVLDVLEARP